LLKKSVLSSLYHIFVSLKTTDFHKHMYKKVNVAVLMGGTSDERDISLNSGKNIFNSIDTNIFEPYRVVIQYRGWFVEVDGMSYPLDKNIFGFTNAYNEIIRFDVAWNIVHGAPGETGHIQGYLDIMNIPYSGSNLYASALSMNKHDCNVVLKEAGLPVLPSVKINRTDYQQSIHSVSKKVGFPCIIKPNSAGSSFGITIAENEDALWTEVKKALNYSHEIIVEQFARGIEVTSGVVDYKGQLLALPLTEVIHSGEFFFDTDSKYDHSRGVKEITPSKSVTGEQAVMIQEITKKAFSVLNLGSHARADYIVQGDTVSMLEINSIPGMSDSSVLPQQMEALGIDLKEFITDTLQNLLRQ